MTSLNLASVTITLAELTVRIGESIGPNPFCIETGASYTVLPEGINNLPHTSTYNIVWHIAKPNGGVLWSYDNAPRSLEICKTTLGEDVSYWEGVLGGRRNWSSGKIPILEILT